jgi:hypothetical protein
MSKQVLPGYYTTSEAADHLGVSKTAVQKAATKEKWKPTKIGNVILWYVEDIREYRDHQHRTRLVKELGWQGRGLYRIDDIDIECPVCGAFAISWPAPPEISLVSLCIEGHRQIP